MLSTYLSKLKTKGIKMIQPSDPNAPIARWWNSFSTSGNLLLSLLTFLITIMVGYGAFQYHTASVDAQMTNFRQQLSTQSAEQSARSDKIETKVDLLSQQQLTTYGAVKEIDGEMKTITRQLTEDPSSKK